MTFQLSLYIPVGRFSLREVSNGTFHYNANFRSTQRLVTIRTKTDEYM